MPTEVASTEYGVIIRHDEWNTLELKWLPATKDATEAQARDTMALFAAETEKRKPRFLIVDTTEFLHRWADDMMAWRDKEIIPHYNANSGRAQAITGTSRRRRQQSCPSKPRRAEHPVPARPGWPARPMDLPSITAVTRAAATG
jgi:hypothetical protein